MTKKLIIDAKYDGMEIFKLLSRFHVGRKKLKFVPTEKAFSSEMSIKNSKNKLLLSGSLLTCKHFYMRLLWFCLGWEFLFVIATFGVFNYLLLRKIVWKHFFILKKRFLLLGTTYTPVLVLRFFFLFSFGLSFEPKLKMKSGDLFFHKTMKDSLLK